MANDMAKEKEESEEKPDPMDYQDGLIPENIFNNMDELKEHTSDYFDGIQG
jgi:hypothetical protein